MDNVKCHIKEAGGGEGRRVMGIKKSLQVGFPAWLGKAQIWIRISAWKLTGCVT